MKKKHIYTLGILIVLTILTAFFSRLYIELKHIALIIMLLSGIKFLLVAFQYMELKEANGFWKLFLMGYLLIFNTILLIIYFK